MAHCESPQLLIRIRWGMLWNFRGGGGVERNLIDSNVERGKHHHNAHFEADSETGSVFFTVYASVFLLDPHATPHNRTGFRVEYRQIVPKRP